MLFGLDQSTQTIFLFLFTLVVFFIVPLTYFGIKEPHLQKLQKKSLLVDWRVWTVCIVYALIFGYRYNYLNDWEQYVTYYSYIQNGGDNDGWREPGFYLFVKILTQLGFSYYSMFVIECFFWILSICYLFKDNRKYLVFILPITFITTTDLALTVSRQFFAMSFLLIAYRNYWDRKNVRALVFGLIAPLIHYSAVVWVIIFFFLKKIEYVKPIWMVLVFLIVTLTSSLFYNIISSSVETASGVLSLLFEHRVYDAEIIDDFQSDTIGANIRQMVTLGLTRGLYIYLYYYYRRRDLLRSPILNNIALIGMFGIIVTILLGYNLVFNRIAAYIRFFYDLGWGIFAYIAFVESRHVKSTVRMLVLLVMIYMFGSFFLHIGTSRRAAMQETLDVNPYLIYEKQMQL